MEEELASIRENETWELTNLPAGKKPIGLKWVYKVKKNPEGAILKHKAHLVAKGYVQRQRWILRRFLHQLRDLRL